MSGERREWKFVAVCSLAVAVIFPVSAAVPASAAARRADGAPRGLSSRAVAATPMERAPRRTERNARRGPAERTPAARPPAEPGAPAGPPREAFTVERSSARNHGSQQALISAATGTVGIQNGLCRWTRGPCRITQNVILGVVRSPRAARASAAARRTPSRIAARGRPR